MRDRRTLFIVGAGASSEAGLPIAKGLIDIIANKLDFRMQNGSRLQGFGDDDILDIFQQHEKTRQGMQAYFEAAWRVRDGIVYSNSIDTFLDVHREDPRIQLCGKMAIVKSILEAEQKSKLFVDRDGRQYADLEGLRKTWFFDFARHLSDGIRTNEINRIFEKVSFVIFNYDRCVEHFMYNALRHHYGLDEADASVVMGTLKVIHPYGDIGRLPWQHKDGFSFGFTANRANMEFMASRIKTFTEQIEEQDVLFAIHREVEVADTLVFLGFSYHPENMRLLNLGEHCKTERIFGTAFGLSPSNVEEILNDLRQRIGRELIHRTIKINTPTVTELINVRRELTCSGLLQEYSRSLFSSVPGHT
jgi:hypothetical protein